MQSNRPLKFLVTYCFALKNNSPTESPPWRQGAALAFGKCWRPCRWRQYDCWVHPSTCLIIRSFAERSSPRLSTAAWASRCLSAIVSYGIYFAAKHTSVSFSVAWFLWRWNLLQLPCLKKRWTLFPWLNLTHYLDRWVWWAPLLFLLWFHLSLSPLPFSNVNTTHL